MGFRIILPKDVLIMFLGTSMQPADGRNRRQLSMELHQQGRILHALNQAVFLLYQLGKRSAIGAQQLEPP